MKEERDCQAPAVFKGWDKDKETEGMEEAGSPRGTVSGWNVLSSPDAQSQPFRCMLESAHGFGKW